MTNQQGIINCVDCTVFFKVGRLACPGCGRCPNCGQLRISELNQCPDCDVGLCHACGRCTACDFERGQDLVDAPCHCGYPNDPDTLDDLRERRSIGNFQGTLPSDSHGMTTWLLITTGVILAITFAKFLL
ncbi:MAG: hypothetical protein ABJZ55_06275 [Fuerstiella sp.]